MSGSTSSSRRAGTTRRRYARSCSASAGALAPRPEPISLGASAAILTKAVSATGAIRGQVPHSFFLLAVVLRLSLKVKMGTLFFLLWGKLIRLHRLFFGQNNWPKQSNLERGTRDHRAGGLYLERGYPLQLFIYHVRMRNKYTEWRHDTRNNNIHRFVINIHTIIIIVLIAWWLNVYNNCLPMNLKILGPAQTKTQQSLARLV